MGLVYVDIQVGNEGGGDMVNVPDVLVDTGSAHTVLPASLLAELHVQPKDQGEVIRAREETTAENMAPYRAPGRYGRRGSALSDVWDIGQVNIRIVDAPQVWACPVYFCPVEEYLLGATTLEIFGLMVDPGGDGLVKRVIKARPI